MIHPLLLAETFYTNPQYRVTIDEPDDDDEDGLGTIIVGLMQKERRKMRADGKSDLTIGYAIYQVHYDYNYVSMLLCYTSINARYVKHV